MPIFRVPVSCVSLRPFTSVYEKVDDTLRIPNHSNIFAIGDASLYDEPKTAIAAQNGGEHVVKAINALHQGKELPKYVVVGDSMFVPWGEYVVELGSLYCFSEVHFLHLSKFTPR